MWQKIRQSNLWFFSSFIVPASMLFGYAMGGAWNFTTILMALLLFPAMEFLMGKDDIYPLPQGENFYQPILYGYTATNILMIFFGVWAAGHTQMTFIEGLGLTLALGVVGVIGWIVCHEMMHKTDPLNKTMARSLLSMIHMGGVFEPHHILVHHNPKYTCTDKDYSLGKLNQPIYEHLYHFIKNEYNETWEAETKRLTMQKKPVVSHHNIVIVSAILKAFTFWAAFMIGGFAGLAVFAGQRIVTISITYAGTYIQHYGLERKKLENGKYEPYTDQFTWNCNHLFTNYILVNMPRHAHHHAQATLPYDQLLLTPDAPRLPYGYFSLVPVVFAPPLWFKLMNKYVARAFGRTDEAVTQDNQPSAEQNQEAKVA